MGGFLMVGILVGFPAGLAAAFLTDDHIQRMGFSV
jgi:hypothetical protein